MNIMSVRSADERLTPRCNVVARRSSRRSSVAGATSSSGCDLHLPHPATHVPPSAAADRGLRRVPAPSDGLGPCAMKRTRRAGWADPSRTNIQARYLLRSTPRQEHDLMIAARNSWVLAFDNLSRLPAWLSDALCRLATGPFKESSDHLGESSARSQLHSIPSRAPSISPSIRACRTSPWRQ